MPFLKDQPVGKGHLQPQFFEILHMYVLCMNQKPTVHFAIDLQYLGKYGETPHFKNSLVPFISGDYSSALPTLFHTYFR